MAGILRVFLVILAHSVVVAMAAPASQPSPLPPLPDKEGFAGSFAGVSNDALLVAGGANFPDKKPWDGGKKVWYDAVYVLDKPTGEWKLAGRLPRPLGYGVSVTHRDAAGDAVVCVGGSDAGRHYADAFRLRWANGKLVTTPLPPLPAPVANSCGALVGDTLYVAGGQASPAAVEASNATYTIDLSAAELRWRQVAPCPGGGRILAVAAAADGAFWMAGGAALSAGADGKADRRYLKDAWRYDPAKGWARLAELPRSVVAAPSPAPGDAGGGVYVLGGDDGSQVGVSPDRHRGFARDVLRYDRRADRWAAAGELAAPSVTTGCVRWGDAWVVPSGEVRPGVRSPTVWTWTPPPPPPRAVPEKE